MRGPAPRARGSAAPRSAIARPGRRGAWVSRAGGALHFLAQAQRPHVRPHLLDVGEAFGLGARLARVAPARRVLAVRGPDRVLLLVVDHDLVHGLVVVFFARHVSSLSWLISSSR